MSFLVLVRLLPEKDYMNPTYTCYGPIPLKKDAVDFMRLMAKRRPDAIILVEPLIPMEDA